MSGGRRDRAARPASAMSPAGRRAGRERAEALALAEAALEARIKREKSERLRQLRLARDGD